MSKKLKNKYLNNFFLSKEVNIFVIPTTGNLFGFFHPLESLNLKSDNKP